MGGLIVLICFGLNLIKKKKKTSDYHLNIWSRRHGGNGLRGFSMWSGLKINSGAAI